MHRLKANLLLNLYCISINTSTWPTYAHPDTGLTRNPTMKFQSIVAWTECNWLHGRWGAVKAFIPDHIASQYRRFISFQCSLDRMQSCTSSTNLTICPFFGTYCTIGTYVTNQREVCMGVLDVYTVLGETTRNPTNTMVKPLDSNVQLQL